MSDSSPPDDPRLGSLLSGRYHLVERLGAGGMGLVYRGKDRETGQQVAVKFLHESLAFQQDFVKRFEREVKVMRRLNHLNLTAVLDSGVAGTAPYLVMEFHPGKSLERLIESGSIPLLRAVGIARQILAGMQHAHACGVIHRDLKPDNVILLDGMSSDVIKILDFGLAKLMDDDGAGSGKLTETGDAMGTPSYMSPEQADGRKADPRTDLYSVGVMLYEMVVGKRPFVAETAMAVMRMHVARDPTPPRKAAPKRGVTEELEHVV